jgi:hypothetical protein
MAEHEPSQVATFLPELNRIKTAMLDGLIPDLRAGETRPSEAKLAALAAARARRASFWLDALTGKKSADR